jgi:hypothetical protein
MGAVGMRYVSRTQHRLNAWLGVRRLPTTLLRSLAVQRQQLLALLLVLLVWLFACNAADGGLHSGALCSG